MRFLHRGRAPLLAATLWCGRGAQGLACPICFQVEQGPVTDGVRMAVLVLIGVTVAVLAGFAKFIAGFAMRANALAAASAGATPGSEGAEPVEKRPDPLCR